MLFHISALNISWKHDLGVYDHVYFDKESISHDSDAHGSVKLAEIGSLFSKLNNRNVDHSYMYGRPKWTKRAFININKSFININKSFININKSFININKWHDLLILINHLLILENHLLILIKHLLILINPQH